MSEVVNLNKFRKRKSRADDARRAETNRAAFGRTKAEKRSDEDARERLARTLDSSRLDKP